MQLKAKNIRDAIARKWVVVKQRGLKPPPKHGPIFLIMKKQSFPIQEKPGTINWLSEKCNKWKSLTQRVVVGVRLVELKQPESSQIAPRYVLRYNKEESH